MTATYIATNITHSTMEIEKKTNIRLSITGITIPTKHNKGLNIINAYYPNSSRHDEDIQWIEDADTTNYSWIIGGDFNLRHPLWDDTASEVEAKHLIQTLDTTNLTILNDGNPTRIGQRGQNDTAPDITLATPDISLDATWQTGNDNLQSDHLPIHIEINRNKLHNNETDSTPKFIYNKANWNKFRTHLNDIIKKEDPANDDIEAYYHNVQQIILKAASLSIPQKPTASSKKPHQHSAIWWNEKCTDAQRHKRRALRNYQKNPTTDNKEALQQATEICKNTAEQAKADHWEAFCRDEIKSPADAGQLWQRFNLIRRKGRPPERRLLYNGRMTQTNEEKANALAETFAKASQTEHLPEEAKQIRQNKPETNDTTNDNTTPFNSDITLQEVKAAINALTNKSKATGPDPISYHIIKQLNDPAINMIHKFFQTCWNTGKIPQKWKEAEVIGIHKAGKPPKLPSSYRPIALTPHLGKLYERLMQERLQYHLDKTDALPKCQAGFRKGRSCMEHVAALLEDIKEGQSRRLPYTTTAAFFDIHRAFDSVWHDKLLNKLLKIGINGRLYQFIKTFLKQRQITVKIGAAKSNTHTLDMGVPQGSVIAPLLFSIILHDIDTATTDPNTKISLYADDLAIWAQHVQQASVNAMRKFQAQIDSIKRYLEENGFQLSAEKTTFMTFNRNPTKHNYYIKLDHTTISPAKQVKFLGVTIHQSLIWGPHINQLITKARRGLSALKLLTAERWTTPQSNLHVAHALIRSRLTYGKEVFFTATDTEWNKLRAMDTASIKTALNLRKHAITDLTYQEAGWLPIYQECRRLNANFEVRREVVPNAKYHSILKRPTRADINYRILKNDTKMTQIETHTDPLWEASMQEPANAIPWPTNHLPTWTLEKPHIKTDSPQNLTKKENPNYLNALAKETIATRYKNHLQVYTDGSLQTDKSAGCAATVPDLKITKKAKLNNGISIFTAELHAIHLACNILLELQARPQAPYAAVILTDSKSALQALNRKHNQNRRELTSEIKHQCHQLITQGLDLTLQWIPSHAGIPGNDTADREAKNAVTDGSPTNLQLSTKEIQSQIKAASKTIRNTEMKTTCQERGWLHQPHEGKRLRTGLPRHNLTILARLRTNCRTALHLEKKCECGHDPTLDHALNPCNNLPTTLHALKDYMDKNNLQKNDMLLPHRTLGLTPAKTLSDAIREADIDSWF